VTVVGQIWSRVTDRVLSAGRRGGTPAIAALDIGTEYAKALVLGVERDGWEASCVGAGGIGRAWLTCSRGR
jgi:hypothetical protein